MTVYAADVRLINNYLHDMAAGILAFNAGGNYVNFERHWRGGGRYWYYSIGERYGARKRFYHHCTAVQ